MPEVSERPAAESDLSAIAAVTAATGQQDEWAGPNPAYVHHLMAHGRVVVAELGGKVAGFGAVRQIGTAAAVVLQALAQLEGPETEPAKVCLPAPHPAVRALLAVGWRVDEFDLFMASEPGLLDPRRAVPSPALA